MDKKAAKAEALRRALESLSSDRPDVEEDSSESPAVCPHCGANIDVDAD